LTKRRVGSAVDGHDQGSAVDIESDVGLVSSIRWDDVPDRAKRYRAGSATLFVALFVYGIIQSGLTCAIAAGIASFPFIATGTGTLVTHWSSFVAWTTMLPIMLFAAQAIRSLTQLSTRED
jgi:hypothetical protein